MDHNVNNTYPIVGIYLLLACENDIISGNVVCNVTNDWTGTGRGISFDSADCINNVVILLADL